MLVVVLVGAPVLAVVDVGVWEAEGVVAEAPGVDEEEEDEETLVLVVVVAEVEIIVVVADPVVVLVVGNIETNVTTACTPVETMVVSEKKTTVSVPDRPPNTGLGRRERAPLSCTRAGFRLVAVPLSTLKVSKLASVLNDVKVMTG